MGSISESTNLTQVSSGSTPLQPCPLCLGARRGNGLHKLVIANMIDFSLNFRKFYLSSSHGKTSCQTLISDLRKSLKKKKVKIKNHFSC